MEKMSFEKHIKRYFIEREHENHRLLKQEDEDERKFQESKRVKEEYEHMMQSFTTEERKEEEQKERKSCFKQLLKSQCIKPSKDGKTLFIDNVKREISEIYSGKVCESTMGEYLKKKGFVYGMEIEGYKFSCKAMNDEINLCFKKIE